MNTNIIADKAIIRLNVELGHFCVIEDDVIIGYNPISKNYVKLR